MTVAGDAPPQPATSTADSPLPPSPVPVSGDSGGGACGGGGGFALPVPAVRVTSEYDSDSALFFHKISCRFFDRLAKLKLSFHNDRNGDVGAPQLGFITKYLSVLYDFEDQNALVRGSFDLGSSLQLRAAQDVKVCRLLASSLPSPSFLNRFDDGVLVVGV